MPRTIYIRRIRFLMIFFHHCPGRQWTDSRPAGMGTWPCWTGWQAFAHVAIATAFIGPLRDPIRNRWVVEFGMLVCALLIPWTLLMAVVRHIPWFWQLMDMSFGVFGILPLWWVRRDILRLESLER